MIIKGGSRGGPKWLGRHLTRTDTNERVEVLELQSPHDNLTEAFRDWQTIAEGTSGRKGLYHANIDPALGYAMTRDQWWRSVQVLEHELHLEGQPRAVVLHNKNGREHLHVVWSRTDLATMTLKSDSHNFAAHERASLALEREFGHEHVPGKHAKRDRNLQQEPPKAALSQAEWQQAERTGLDPRAVKAEIARLFAQSDTGRALQAGLEDAGYVLAKGDRDFVVVDQGGGIHALGRAVKVPAAALRVFMRDVTRDDLPTVAEARGRQEARAAEAEARPSAEAERLRAAILARQAMETQKLTAFQDTERQRRTEAIDADIAEKLGHVDAMQAAAMMRYDRETAPQGMQRWIEVLRRAVDSTWAKEQERARIEARLAYWVTLTGARAETHQRLVAARDAELADLAERHAQQLREQESRFRDELARQLRAQDADRQARARLEEHAPTMAEHHKKDREGPDPPTRAR